LSQSWEQLGPAYLYLSGSELDLHWSDDARARKEGCVCHLWHTCHRFAITGLEPRIS